MKPKTVLQLRRLQLRSVKNFFPKLFQRRPFKGAPFTTGASILG